MTTKIGERAAKRKTKRSSETDKQLALEAIRNLPDEVTLSEIADEIAMLHSIEEGLKDADAGRVISHEEMKRRMKQWLSK